MKNRIFVFGDIHFPFHHKKALKVVMARLKKFKPTHVVQIGDLYDQYSFSRYPKKPGTPTPEQEMNKARALGEKFWSDIKAAVPNAQCFQILGNHDIRLSKKVSEKLPEVSTIIHGYLKEMYTFPGVKTMNSASDELLIGDVMFIHGYLSKLGDHSKKNISKIVVGHSHVGGIVYYKYNKKILWEANCGYLADKNQIPLQYGEQKRNSWTLGNLEIDEDGPKFISLNL